MIFQKVRVAQAIKNLLKQSTHSSSKDCLSDLILLKWSNSTQAVMTVLSRLETDFG